MDILQLAGNYYGIDWAALIAMCLSMFLLGNKNRWGFIAGMIGAVCWIIFGIMARSIADPVANILVFFISLRGWLRWRPA